MATARLSSPAESAGQVRSPAVVVRLFLLVAALTALELLAIGLDAARAVRVTALAGLVIIKAAVILWSFMHLGQQRRSLRIAVLTPIVLGAALAVILMLDGVVRLGGGP
jgi:heme/copper-type cytochrome/quinol oxidase subunit 4